MVRHSTLSSHRLSLLLDEQASDAAERPEHSHSLRPIPRCLYQLAALMLPVLIPSRIIEKVEKGSRRSVRVRRSKDQLPLTGSEAQLIDLAAVARYRNGRLLSTLINMQTLSCRKRQRRRQD